MENNLRKKRRYTYKLSEMWKQTDSAPLEICKSAELAETSGSRSGSFQVEIEYALLVATNEHLVKSAKEKYEEGCSLIKLDDPNIFNDVRKEHAVFYLYKTLMDCKCIADCGNTKNVASSSSADTLSGERNGHEEHNFAMDSSLYQVEELVDGTVTESAAVTDQALENQANSMTNSHSNFYVKQELQSENEDDHPTLLDFCLLSPKTEHLFETEEDRNSSIIESVGSLCEPVVEQHQNGGLSQPKGLPTPSTQHPDTDMEVVDDRLENIDKRCSTIDHVSLKKEMEHDEYYTHDIVPQPVNMENQTSDIVTSVQLEENVGRVLDSKGRNGKIEGKKEESQKGKITSDEREVLIWNRENTSSEVAELDGRGLPTPCPQLIAHHDTGMEVVDDRLENIEKQNVTNTSNTFNHVSVKVEPENGDGYTRDLPYQPANNSEGNTENERSDVITSGRLEENFESGLESGVRSGKMEEKKEGSEELEMSVEEEESVCQKQENSVSDIADKKEQAEKMAGMKGTDSKCKSAERPHGQQKEKQGKLQCDVCGYSTNHKSHLTDHKRIHTQEKPFSCDVCGYTTKKKSHLTDHKRIHTQEKLFACDVCGFSTNWKSRLNTHMRTHAQEKRFACDVCDHTTNWKSHLNVHMRTHMPTQEKLFACDICGHTTNWKTHLNAHMRMMHRPTQEKLFVCDVCGFSTNWKSSLTHHKRVHTK